MSVGEGKRSPSPRREFLVSLAALGLAGCATAGPKPAIAPLTVPPRLYEGETQVAVGLEGAIHVDRPVGGIARLDLARAASGLVPIRPPGRRAIHGLGTPGHDGATAFLTAADDGGRRYAVRLLVRGEERILFEGEGEPLWDRPVAGLALSPDASAIAYVQQLQPGTKYTPLHVGRLVVRNLVSAADGLGDELAANEWVRHALGQRPGWLPDGERLLFASAGPEGRALKPAVSPAAQPDPMICLLDRKSRSVSTVTRGHSPVLSRDGKSALVARGKGLSWGLVDLPSGTARRIDPIAGLVRPVGFLASRYVIYVGASSAGAPEGYTTNNSPLVGPKRMLSLKVADLRTGAFQTLLDGVDPRREFVVS